MTNVAARQQRAIARLIPRDYLWLALAFAATRVVFFVLGLRYRLELNWMFLADLGHLRDHLLRTVYYFHAFPPGMNLLTGAILKIAPVHAAAVAHAVFLASGLLLVCSLFYVARALGLSRAFAFGLCLAFSITPPTLYFENLYLYDYPVPALLTFAAALFHRALVTQRFPIWLALFAVCSVLGLVRSAFHLIWFVALGALAYRLAMRPTRRTLLLAAVGPAALFLALYVKNYLVFGVFDAQSQSGGNSILVTTYHLPPDLRETWVREGKISPFGAMGFATPPREFVRYFDRIESDRWPGIPELNDLERPTQRAGNYNHWYFLKVNELRRQDSLYYLRHRPDEYLHTVFFKGLPGAFGPSTRWHPFTGRAQSPHHDHRLALGAYEDSYNRVVHGIPWAPFGLYTLLPLSLAWASFRGVNLVRSRSERQRNKGALLLFCLFQIGYLLAVTVFLTWGEQARYRYIVEPLIWAVAGRSVLALVRHWRVGRARQPSATLH